MRFFSGDNILFRTCEQLFDLLLLSVIWAMLCVPIVTIGPATTALYYAVVKCVRHNEQGTFLNFWTSFRQNFKVGAIAGCIAVGGAAVLLLCHNAAALMMREGGPLGSVIYYAESVVLVLLLGLALWLAPILSRFTVKVGQLFLTAAQLGLRHLPSTLAVSLLFLVAARLTIAFISPLLLVPGLCALAGSFFFERAFRRHLPDPPSDEDGDAAAPPWYLQ